MPKVYVSYAYYEGADPRYQKNLEYFLKMGCPPDPDVTYKIMVQGHTCSQSHLIPKHVEVVRTENTGFDLGAHGKGMNDDTVDKHDLFVFMNSGCRGPFLPSYWPQKAHWYYAFMERMKRHDNPGIVGVSNFCHPKIKKPVVETWCFAMPKNALKDVRSNTTVFNLHQSKSDAVVNGEDTLGPYLYDQGYDLDCMLYKYLNTNWKEQDNTCNGCGIPSRPWNYAGISMHPFETIFYKTYWQSAKASENGYKCPFEQRYTEWALGEEECTDREHFTDLKPQNVIVDSDDTVKKFNPYVVLSIVLGTILVGTFVWLSLIYSKSIL